MHTTDLHIHSRYSEDGTFLPEQLAAQCKAAGIVKFAIADHNSVRGVASGIAAAERLGLECVPAIEIDCTLDGVNLHVLGYGIDYAAPEFDELDENISAQARDASHGMLCKLNALGFAVTEAQMIARCSDRYRPYQWTGELFADVLLSDPSLAAHPMLLPYREGGARGVNPLVNFYWDWFSQGKPCHVPMQYPTASEVLALIHRHGGKAVIAHPGVNLKGHAGMLDELAAMGLDGVEAQSSYHTREQAQAYAADAKRLGLFTTCGSDFHGETKPAIGVGMYPEVEE